MSRDPFIAQLAGLCRAEPTRAKWVLVPAHAIGHTLGDRLAREGTDWANLRFVTPLDVAIRMAAPFLLERGVDPSEESLGPALVMRLLLDLPEETGYFRRMATHASMAEALWRTLRELRFAGLRAADLPAGAFASPRKHRELVALLRAYEEYLERRRLADLPVVYDEALRHPDWSPIAPHDIVTELPGTVWPPRVRRFLDALPGERVRGRALVLPGVALPGRADRLAAPVEHVGPPAATDAARLRFLQAPADAGPARGDGTIEILHAGGRDAEIDEVVRRIAATGRPLDEVEIACASGAYAQLVWEKAARLGWAVTLSAGHRASGTRPGRLLLRFCEWVGSNLAAASLRRLLQSGDCAPAAFDLDGRWADDSRVTPGQAARLLLKAQATWGRETYPRALKRLAEEYDRRAADTEGSDEDRQWNRRKAAQARTLDAWARGVLASLPVPDATGLVPLRGLIDAAVAFLDANAARAGATDAMALVALTGALRELDTLGDYRCSIAAGLDYLAGCVGSLAVGRDRPRPGQLHVSSLADAGFDGRPLVFVVGLQEGGVFPPPVEDPVLLDTERASISPMLRTANDRLDEAVYRTLSRLAEIGASAERVCLSFSCRDTRDFRDTFPSWIVLQAYRLEQGDAALTYEHLGRSLGEPASAVPGDAGLAATDAGWWLATCASNAGAGPGILRAFPSLARGRRAEAARDADVFTEFDGHVAAAGPLLDPTRSGRAVSATTLEQAASCPFRFFLEQGLGVRPLEEPEADADAWLDAKTKGSELHALFARILRDIRARTRDPDLKKDLPRLGAWGEARLAELRDELPPPSGEVYARERREFLDDLEAFLAAECEGRHGPAPVALEVGFGLPLGDDNPEPLASAEPVVFDLGGGRRLRLRGRIDRINRLGPGRYEVIDYKTGSYYGPAWNGEFAGGTRLQHALYGRAAVALLGGRGTKAEVVRGSYVFPAVKGHRRRKNIAAPSPATLNAVLRPLMDVLGTGAYAAADAKEKCKFCELAGACHALDPDAGEREKTTRATAKVENLANTVLDPYRELRRHE
jgi:ATP-dependent helicase/nuclease subunit B